ncbi:hypothetical protein GGR56DRAFT_673241 [Xylariaceae sp. FL0804]|nr:hypothetical protein GGR56DRAFT_673241 [Xylariaceae sp. FL0804]
MEALPVQIPQEPCLSSRGEKQMASVEITQAPCSPDSGEKPQLLTEMLDNLARTKPNELYSIYPESPDSYDEGFRELTWERFANAVNGLAWWLTIQLGTASPALETVTYTGPNDFRCGAIVLACSKAGLKLLMSSPRNKVQGVGPLLDTLQCGALLAADPSTGYALTLQEARPMPAYQVPTVKALLGQTFPEYPTSKTYEQAKDDPLVIMHTSGTTAAPKPIPYTNAWMAAYTRVLRTPPPAADTGMELKDIFARRSRMLIMMSPFHAAHLILTLFHPVVFETAHVVPPANLLGSVELFVDVIRKVEIDNAFLPPHMVSEVALNADYLDTTAARLKTLITGGGNLLEAHGDLVATRIPLQTAYGATEFGLVADRRLRDARGTAAWNYVSPHANAGWEMRPAGRTEAGEVFEAVVVRPRSADADPESAVLSPVFSIYGDRPEYLTRDLWMRHATLADHWRWVGRSDDTVALGTGANVSPHVMEEGVGKLAGVRGALMLGNGLLRPVLLVEPRAATDDAAARARFLDEIWPAVEAANQGYWELNRILREHVVITRVDRPMVRSQKGAVQRATTARVYEAELKALFRNAEE